MNIAVLQMNTKVNAQMSQNGVPMNNATSNRFGTVFRDIVSQSLNSPSSIQHLSGNTVLNEQISAIVKATTSEQLDELVKALESMFTIEEDANIQELLKKIGLVESEETKDFDIFDVLDNGALWLAEHLTSALDGKEELSESEAVQLLIFIKKGILFAQNSDLLLKQEQQLFSAKHSLLITGEQLGNDLTSKSSTKVDSFHLLNSKMTVKVLNQMSTEGNTTNREEHKNTSENAQPSINGATGTTGSARVNLAVDRSGTTNSETLIREMQAIMNRANFGQVGGTNRLLIKMYPEHLGQIRIELIETNGILSARILASTALGKEMLDSHMNQLRHAFIQQNLQVDRIDVAQTLQDTSRNDREQSFNQQFRREQEQSDEKNNKSEENEMTFEDYLIELEA